MAYDDDQVGVATSDVTELYEFTGPSTVYRYTSGPASVTYGGHAYAPAAGLGRSTLSSTSTEDTAKLTVTIAASASVIVAHGRALAPRSLGLRVYRQQATSGETRRIWDGEVKSITSSSTTKIATVTSESRVGGRLAARLPVLTIGPRCPHRLYDDRCRVNPDDFDLTTTVSSISGRTVTVASVGGQPDGWFGSSGEIRRDSDGERRSIITQVGAVLTLIAPFSTLAPGDSVTLWAGCDHLYWKRKVGPDFAGGDCIVKFDNAINFGGAPAMPSLNPFTAGVRGDR